MMTPTALPLRAKSIAIASKITLTKACVIEIKVCKEKESRAKKANEAIEQILEKHYADTIFEDENITCVNAIGIAFSGKNCFISCKKIK